MTQENKNKKAALDQATEIDEAARRLNDQILWENAINGMAREEDDAQSEKPLDAG